MNKEELKIVKEFIYTLGYYQCFNAVQDWFKWDEKTTQANVKYALAEQNKQNRNEQV